MEQLVMKSLACKTMASVWLLSLLACYGKEYEDGVPEWQSPCGSLKPVLVTQGLYLVAQARIVSDTCHSGLSAASLNQDIVYFNSDDMLTSLRSDSGYFVGEKTYQVGGVPVCAMPLLTHGPAAVTESGCSWNSIRTNAMLLGGDDLFQVYTQDERSGLAGSCGQQTADCTVSYEVQLHK